MRRGRFAVQYTKDVNKTADDKTKTKSKSYHVTKILANKHETWLSLYSLILQSQYSYYAPPLIGGGIKR